jgi:hypothetical protein
MVLSSKSRNRLMACLGLGWFRDGLMPQIVESVCTGPRQISLCFSKGHVPAYRVRGALCRGF